MFSTVGALIGKAVRKIATCCCAEYDSSEDEIIISEAPAKTLTVQTSENCAFYASVPETKTTGTEDDQSDIGKRENVMEMNNSGDTNLLINPDLLRNGIITEDDTGTKDEQLIHGTYQDPFQYKMVTEEEPSACFGAANMPTTTRCGREPKALTHPSPQIDENITQKEPSPHFQAKEINKECTANMTMSKVLDETDCCYQEEDSKTNQDLDPTLFFCKFPNSFNNCWMNAAIQSFLHLSVARKVVTQHPEEIFGALSATPLCADLLCSAMHQPGRYFFSEEIYQVLLEITEKMMLCDFGEQNDPIYFLETILSWLNPTGINTVCTVHSAATCEECQRPFIDRLELGPIIFLPQPEPYDSTISLLNCMFAEYEGDYCDVCGCVLKKKYVINDSDVIVLYLSSLTSYGDLRCPVIPSGTLDIPVKGGTLLYRLSSVICSQSLSPEAEHFYTYLMCGQMVYKAEDIQVTTANNDCVADICHNGFIYIYEKYTEGDDKFSVWIKATPEQENCNPENAANMPTTTRCGREPKALTHPCPQIDENITQKELSPHFQAKEINKECTANMTMSKVLDETDCCYQEEDSKTNQDLDPTLFFCKFPNWFNNCWMNAAIQSFLHLSVARKVVTQHPEEIFGALSATPLCADLLCSAMHQPGRYFFSEEIYQVLLEITEKMMLCDFGEQNDPIYFLETILSWLNPTGINTVCTVHSAATCEECQRPFIDRLELGPIIFLPQPEPYDSTISLLNCMFAEYEGDYCDVCGCVLKKKYVINDSDVIVLYLSSLTSYGDLRCPVIPSGTLDIPVKGGTLLYRLSSVICSQSLSPEAEHFYTYLMCGQMVYKAEDIQVTTANNDCVADICHNGFIYIYEKYTEGDDKFSVWIKATPQQENCNPESAANMPTTTRCGREPKALTHPCPQIDENITQKELSPHFQAKEINKECTANMTMSKVLDETDCCYQEEDSKTNQDLDPTLFFCKFPNSFNNCWMNAAIQSFLHLSVARKVVTQHPEEIFGALSATPLCADLLCSAMHQPGRYFFSEEIYQVLLEITEKMMLCDFGEQNDPIYFLETILSWLNPTGINTVCTVHSAATCEECQRPFIDRLELGPIIFLPQPEPYDSTISLLNCMFAEYEGGYCDVCGCDLKKKYVINDSDVIVLYLSSLTSYGDLRCPVIPSGTLDIPVKGGTLLYRLSSVICSQSLSPEAEHFYTYLMCGQMVYKAEDIQVTTANNDCVADICHNGFIYIYEKYTEGDDKFSVWIKATPQQENCNPESAANMPTTTRCGREPKALTHPSPQIDGAAL